MTRLTTTSSLAVLALFGFCLSGSAKAADSSLSKEGIRSLHPQTRTDSFLQGLPQGHDWMIQVVSYKFAPQIRVYEMGVADPSGRGVARGILMASSLENQTGRRETSDCQVFTYQDGNSQTVYGSEVHLRPLHNGPYVIEVNGNPVALNSHSATIDYRIVIEAEAAAVLREAPLQTWGVHPPIISPSAQPSIAAVLAQMAAQSQTGAVSSPPITPPQPAPASPFQPQFQPSPNNPSQPTAEDMLIEGEALLRTLGAILW